MAYQTSQGLASLGRNGDTMLMHVNPTEVAGLQSLAMSQGGSLTINPQTGLPEAFKLGGFFKSLLPMFAGIATGGAGMPLWAGIAAGAATGAVTSKDKLMGAITGGLGGYGGFGIGKSLLAAGTPTLGAVGGGSSGLATGGGYIPGATSAADIAYNSAMMGPTAGATTAAAGNVGTSMMTDPSILNARNAAQAINTGGGGSGSILSNSAASPAEQSLSQYGSNLSQSYKGAGNILSGDQVAIDAYTKGMGAKTPLGALGKTALPIGGAALGGIEPSDLYGEPINMDEAKKKQAYDPYASLNLSGDTGLRLYADGGSIQSGGIRDLYGSSDNQTQAPLSRDGYGLGRLNQLGNEQSLTQAQTLGYAEGGDIEEANTGMNLDALPSLNLNTGMQDGGMGGYDNDKLYSFNDKAAFSPVGRMLLSKMPQSDRAKFLGSGMGAFFGMQERPKQEYYTSSGELTSRYAMGGPVSFADGGDSNKEDVMGLPSLTTDAGPETQVMNLGNIGFGQGLVRNLAGNMQQMIGAQGSATPQGQMPDQTDDSLIAKVTANLKADPNYQPTNPIEASIVRQIKGTDPMQLSQQGLGSLGPSQPMAQSFNPSVAMGPTYFAGMNAPQGYADGGDVGGNAVDESAPNPEGIVSKYTTVVDGKGVASRERVPYQYEKIITKGAEDFYDIPPIEYAANLYPGSVLPKFKKEQGYAEGGETSLNLDRLPSLNVNSPTSLNLNSPRQFSGKDFKPNSNPPIMNDMLALMMNKAITGGQFNNASPKLKAVLNLPMARGGYLNGQGDGMSDSIPATIEGKQPARLADGEFVVPADVVSHIGNGSSKAGSKRLYAMLDKVRKARTGHTKQGKQIKPEKYMPA